MITTKILSKNEINDACHLLYDEYIKPGLWQFLDDNPSHLKIIIRNNRKLLVDRITEHAIWFGAFDGSKLVGCIRLFKATDKVPLEIEMYSSAKDIFEQYVKANKSNIYEGTRACVASEYRGKSILTKLYLAILEYVQERKASIFGLASNSYVKSVLRRMSWTCKKEDAFKFEESDISPVSFYLVSYDNGEIANTIQKIKLIESSRNRKTIDILEALNIVAPIFPSPMYWHDLNGVVLGANVQCLTAMCRSQEQVLGKTPYDFYPKEVADHIWKHSNQVIKSGETLFQEEYAYEVSGKCVGTYWACRNLELLAEIC